MKFMLQSSCNYARRNFQLPSKMQNLTVAPRIKTQQSLFILRRDQQIRGEHVRLVFLLGSSGTIIIGLNENTAFPVQ